MERFFEETMEMVEDRSSHNPANIDAVVASYYEAEQRHCLEFV